nr:MAG TPA: hypothetical protein [Caudoviricetes sp.]
MSDACTEFFASYHDLSREKSNSLQNERKQNTYFFLKKCGSCIEKISRLWYSRLWGILPVRKLYLYWREKICTL